MSYNRTALTLGELLTSEDVTIKRNAMSILKVLTNCDHHEESGRCMYCLKPMQQQKDPNTCHRCGLIHDVELAGGHDLLETERIMRCKKVDHPDDEALQDVEPLEE